MTPVGDDVDLGPWAAYTMGHHPYALMAWHMDSWTALRDSLNKFEPDYQHADPPELGELGEALAVLAAKGRVDPVALNEILRCREELVEIGKEIGEIAEGRRSESEVLDTDSLVEPCYGTLGGMIMACDGLITGTEVLRTWMRLGAAVGEYPLIITRGITTRWQSLGECLDDLQDSMQRLATLGEYSFLAQLDHRLAMLDPGAQSQPGDLESVP